MWQCCLSTDTGGTGQSKSPRDVHSRTDAEYADQDRADRTTPVRLIRKHQKQITKPSNHQSTPPRNSICGGVGDDTERRVEIV